MLKTRTCKRSGTPESASAARVGCPAWTSHVRQGRGVRRARGSRPTRFQRRSCDYGDARRGSVRLRQPFPQGRGRNRQDRVSRRPGSHQALTHAWTGGGRGALPRRPPDGTRLRRPAVPPEVCGGAPSTSPLTSGSPSLSSAHNGFSPTLCRGLQSHAKSYTLERRTAHGPETVGGSICGRPRPRVSIPKRTRQAYSRG
jgi:hypothetical protein